MANYRDLAKSNLQRTNPSRVSNMRFELQRQQKNLERTIENVLIKNGVMDDKQAAEVKRKRLEEKGNSTYQRPTIDSNGRTDPAHPSKKVFPFFVFKTGSLQHFLRGKPWYRRKPSERTELFEGFDEEDAVNRVIKQKCGAGYHAERIYSNFNEGLTSIAVKDYVEDRHERMQKWAIVKD